MVQACARIGHRLFIYMSEKIQKIQKILSKLICQGRKISTSEFLDICDKYSLSPIEVDFLSTKILEKNLFRKEISQVKTKDELIEALKSLNIPYIDNRPKKGVLWVLGGIEIQSAINRLSSMGYVFHLKECGGKATKGQSAWWTQ